MQLSIRPTEVCAALKDRVSHYCETLGLLLAALTPTSLSVMLMVYDDLLF